MALTIKEGMSVFVTSFDGLQIGNDVHEQESAKHAVIMIFRRRLFFDIFAGQWQSHMFQLHRELSMLELLFANATFSNMLSFIPLARIK